MDLGWPGWREGRATNFNEFFSGKPGLGQNSLREVLLWGAQCNEFFACQNGSQYLPAKLSYLNVSLPGPST
jgi:hypothetical protein